MHTYKDEKRRQTNINMSRIEENKCQVKVEND